ncbi:MAG: response regulator transcription factor [Cyclobacteriaceae bacterium]|nr:response regulator transcription factor [Cyclobacteriaceae bacterium]
MRVLIIEDELPARDKLETLLRGLIPDLTIVGKIGSVKESIAFFNKGQHPDLAFVDIHLSDDHSFEIFRSVEVGCPVIFTTAYDKYLLESLEFNSIDYILKPITLDRLRLSLKKVSELERHFTKSHTDKLLQYLEGHQVQRERLLARKGLEFMAVPLEEIAYIFSEHKVTFLRDKSGQRYTLDKNLTELESTLDKARFFRINRKYIAAAEAIDRFKPDNGKLRVYLKPTVDDEVHVSKEQAAEFKKWISGE